MSYDDFEAPFAVGDVDLTNDSFDPIPEGKYLAQAIEASMKPTKAGTGTMLNYTFEIIDGPYEKRRVWLRLNWKNPNQKAVEIGRRDFARFVMAVGLDGAGSKDDLLFRPLIIDVVIEPGTGGYRDSNEIKRFIPADGGATKPARAPAAPGAHPAAAPPPAARTATAGSASRPWDNAR